MTLPFPPKKDDQKVADLATKSALLRRFASQIAPSLHDQSTLLCTALAPNLIQQLFVSLYLSHIDIKTRPAETPNPQLDFIFHHFTPVEGGHNPASYEEILNLIQTGEPSTAPADKDAALLPAPFYTLPEVEIRLAKILTHTILDICAAFTGILTTPEFTGLPETSVMPFENQVEHLARRTAEVLSDFLQKDPSDDKAPLPPGPTATPNDEIPEKETT